MAKAPKPGSAGTTGGDEKVKDAGKILRLTINGEPRELRPGQIDFKTRSLVRKATGRPLAEWLSDFDEDTLRVIWWLAGRGDEPFLTFQKVLDEWPEDLSPDDFDFEQVDPDEDEEDSDPQS